MLSSMSFVRTTTSRIARRCVVIVSSPPSLTLRVDAEILDAVARRGVPLCPKTGLVFHRPRPGHPEAILAIVVGTVVHDPQATREAHKHAVLLIVIGAIRINGSVKIAEQAEA